MISFQVNQLEINNSLDTIFPQVFHIEWDPWQRISVKSKPHYDIQSNPHKSVFSFGHMFVLNATKVSAEMTQTRLNWLHKITSVVFICVSFINIWLYMSTIGKKEKLDVDESSQRDNGFLRCERTYENK